MIFLDMWLHCRQVGPVRFEEALWRPVIEFCVGNGLRYNAAATDSHSFTIWDILTTAGRIPIRFMYLLLCV